jgi:hypothetical protein
MQRVTRKKNFRKRESLHTILRAIAPRKFGSSQFAQFGVRTIRSHNSGFAQFGVKSKGRVAQIGLTGKKKVPKPGEMC